MKYGAFTRFWGGLNLILWATSAFYLFLAFQQVMTPQYCQGSNNWLYFAIFALIPLFINGLRRIHYEKKIKNNKDKDDAHL